jgi:GntR family transcriptional regulator, transcriptional repressor for pyruvate dehydrogenase complex
MRKIVETPDEIDREHDIDGPPVAAKQVVTYIRGLIESGKFRAGDRLPPERELAQLIGVSRPSVRAGLQSLATVGVVDTRRGAGTFVANGPPLFDVNPLSLFSALHGIPEDELFETRRVIEIDLAGMAADRAGGDELAAISEELMEMFASLDDAHRFLVHDIRFHRAVAAAARNPLLAAIMEMVADLFYDLRKTTVDRYQRASEAADQHRAIYQAIRDGNVDLARDEMDRHLRWAQEAQEMEVKTTDNRKAAEE